GELRVHPQRVIGFPAPLETRGQRAAQRRVSRIVEKVHHRLAADAFGDAVELEPGGVRIDDDPLLHLDDRVVRAMQHGAELGASLSRTRTAASNSPRLSATCTSSSGLSWVSASARSRSAGIQVQWTGWPARRRMLLTASTGSRAELSTMSGTAFCSVKSASTAGRAR